jgi:hypothetical protein
MVKDIICLLFKMGRIRTKASSLDPISWGSWGLLLLNWYLEFNLEEEIVAPSKSLGTNWVDTLIEKS